MNNPQSLGEHPCNPVEGGAAVFFSKSAGA
jgi:hypothetical protein